MLDFHRIEHEKYGTTSIDITRDGLKDVEFDLEGCEILDIERSPYHYDRVVIQLSSEKIDEILKVEKEVNQYLKEEGLREVTIVYANKIYAKKKINVSKDSLKCIWLKKLFKNIEGKVFSQIWIK